MKCKECGDVFKQTREWQVFCGNSCRQVHNRRFKEICFYCGVPGNHRDHVHPVKARGTARRYVNQELVYSCQECNNALGAQVFPTIEERVAYLIPFYVSRYSLNKRVTEWDQEDLNELGFALRSSIEAGVRERQEAERRVMYLRKVKDELAGLLEFIGTTGISDENDCYFIV